MDQFKKGLVVGINSVSLEGERLPEEDAKEFQKLIESHWDGSKNFVSKLFVPGNPRMVSHSFLRKKLIQLFDGDPDVALFYFSGQGKKTDSGHYLITENSEDGDWGLNIIELISLANQSSAKEVFIILDCSFFGNSKATYSSVFENLKIRKGVSILTAASDNQIIEGVDGKSKFTLAVIEAMSGGAGDLLGEVTVPGIYEYVNKYFGAWHQRPTFKANVNHFRPIRRAQPRFSTVNLHLLRSIFPENVAPLNPQMNEETVREIGLESKEDYSRLLNQFHGAGLIRTMQGEQSFQEAKFLILTELGRYYWDLIDRKTI